MNGFKAVHIRLQPGKGGARPRWDGHILARVGYRGGQPSLRG